MGIKLSNNAFATLAAGINSSATSITLTTGQGARFPTLSAGDYFYATLIDTSNNLEIVKCTARSTDVLTVTRAQESTTARSYSAGDRIEIRLTAQTFIDAVNEIGPTQVSDEANSSTGYFALPSGTTAQRPATPTGNMIRKNTTTGYVEYYDPATSSWVGLGSFQATGGTTYESGGYKYHKFTTSGTFTVTAGAKAVEVLVVAGGGSGGSRGSAGQGAGAGGAGGVLYNSAFNVATGAYTVTIGAGGAANTTNAPQPGNQGGNSVFGSLTAIGGGFGGAYNGGSPTSGGNGGSGGGGGRDAVSAGGSGTAGQGYAGGSVANTSAEGGGGGGGAGGVGANGGASGKGGNGGVGTAAYSAWGAATSSGENVGGTYYFGGGGGGAAYASTGNRGIGGYGGGGDGGIEGVGTASTSGDVNTGGGGGADSYVGTSSGGSGIVIVRYPV